MTTTREIEQEKNINLFIIIIVLIVFTFFSNLIITDLEIKSSLKDVVRKVCHNETTLIDMKNQSIVITNTDKYPQTITITVEAFGIRRFNIDRKEVCESK